MVQFRPTAREIVAKIVYYGPPLGGKTTNLRMLWEGYPEEVRGELVVLPTGTDRTIYFDYLPLTFRKLRGMDLKIQLYTVPGQVRFDSTRQVVLRGVDGIVFVADSQRQVLAANRESWANLKKNLALQGLFLDRLPHVLQYNKRDLPDILSVEELDAELNEFNAPFFEAVAVQGIGVEETLQSIVRLVVRSLRERFNLGPEPQPTAAPQTAELVTRPVEVKPQPLPREERGVLHPFPLPPPEITPPTVPVDLAGIAGASEEPGSSGTAPDTELAVAPTVQEPEAAFAPPEVPEASPETSSLELGQPFEQPSAPPPTELQPEGVPAEPLELQRASQGPWGGPPAAQEPTFRDFPELQVGGGPGGPEPAFGRETLEAPTVPGAATPAEAVSAHPPEPPLSLGEPWQPQAPIPEAPVFVPEEPAPSEPFGPAPAPLSEPQDALPFPMVEPDVLIGAPQGFEELSEAFGASGAAPGASATPTPVGGQAAVEPMAFQGADNGSAVQEPFFQEEGGFSSGVPAGTAPNANASSIPLGDPFALGAEAPLVGEDVFALVPAPATEVMPPATALERVIPRAVARHGELRELEVEVPVPATWVGGRRVTLQLRLTLVPEEESHEP